MKGTAMLFTAENDPFPGAMIPYHEQFYAAPDYWGRMQVIRRSYLENWARFDCAYPKIDANWIPWHDILSPIERLTWGDIRGKGLPLYPQVPALHYFLDFASPALKVGLEVDGRAYHEVARDRKRDMELMAAGWHIYRCSGSQVHHSVELVRLDECDTFDAEEYVWSIEGLLDAINYVYFPGCRGERVGPQDQEVMQYILTHHRLVSFSIGR